MPVKVSYKKIKCNKNWHRVIFDSCHGLSMADFIDEQTLGESDVVSVLLRGLAKRKALEVPGDD